MSRAAVNASMRCLGAVEEVQEEHDTRLHPNGFWFSVLANGSVTCQSKR